MSDRQKLSLIYFNFYILKILILTWELIFIFINYFFICNLISNLSIRYQQSKTNYKWILRRRVSQIRIENNLSIDAVDTGRQQDKLNYQFLLYLKEYFFRLYINLIFIKKFYFHHTFLVKIRILFFKIQILFEKNRVGYFGAYAHELLQRTTQFQLKFEKLLHALM